MHSAFRPFASPFTLVVATCALGSAIAAVPVAVGTAAELLTSVPGAVVFLAGVTALLSALVVAAALRTRWFLICGFAPSAGAMVAMMSLFVVFALLLAREGNGTDALTAANFAWGAAAALLIGAYAAVVGGIAGMMFAIGLVVPVAVGAWYLKRPSLDGGARTGLVCAPWLAAVSWLGLVAAPPADTWHVGAALAALGLVVALAVGAASLVQVIVVGRFLGRVRRGTERDYRIRAPEAHDDLSAVLVFANAPRTWDRLAVLESLALDAVPYRGPVAAFRPVALVSLS